MGGPCLAPCVLVCCSEARHSGGFSISAFGPEFQPGLRFPGQMWPWPGPAVQEALWAGVMFLPLMGFLLHHPRGGAMSRRSFEPIMAILLFSCTLALHARQVDVKLRLDYLWAAQVRWALSAWGGCGNEAPGSGCPGGTAQVEEACAREEDEGARGKAVPGVWGV